jgi:hypothetical protein
MPLTEQQEKELVESVAGLTKKIAGQETLIQQYKTEIGEARKEMSEFKSVRDELKSLQEKINVDDKKKKVDDPPEPSKKSGQGSADDDKDNSRFKSRLTPEQRRIADEQFKKLPPEERRVIAGDPKEERQFLEAAIEASPPSVPESLFSGSSGADVNKYRELFGLMERESSFVPGGGSGRSSNFAGSSNRPNQQQVEERRLPGGVIPRPTVTQSSKKE